MSKKQKRRSLAVGDTVLNGRYEILKIMHTSGMANVYLVSDRNLNKQWCLKEIVKSEAGKNMVEYRSLIQEANIMKSLNHSSIPRIVTIEAEGDTIFIVMDYVDGISVKKWLLDKGRIDQNVAVTWMKQVCAVMIYLHNRRKPIFYRDMKPDNIMIQSDGNIKLLDFGISVVITEENSTIKEALGTPGYAAPEQKKKGLPYDLRSDIYAFGKTMYYMLTGLNPSIIKDLKPMRSIDSSISLGLEYIVGKCIDEDPDKRYQSFEEVLYALQEYPKMDTNYVKKSERRVFITLSTLILSLVVLGASFIPYMMDKSQKQDLYREKVETAYQTGREEDYIDAISLKPEVIDPYLGYIDSIKSDGVFTKEEENDLLGLINPNLSELKKDEDYGPMAFNMGKLYWFYYEGEDGDVVSSRWFEESIDCGFMKDESTVYYDISTFKENIAQAINESSDSGMYKEYWGNLINALSIDSGEIVELQLYNSIADCISTYSYRLREDGVAKKELLDMVFKIEKYLNASSPSSDKSKEMYENLSQKMIGLSEKVEAAYK